MDPILAKPRFYRASIYGLSFVNLVSLFAAATTVLVLNPEDRISIGRGSWLTALGLIHFMTLFELLNVFMLYSSTGTRWRQQYRLSSGDVMDINNKVVSAVQAVWCCVTGVVVCSYSCSRDFMRSSHYMSEAYAWFGAAYFFYDIWSMYIVHVQMTTNWDYYKIHKTKIQRKLSKNGDPALSSGDSAPHKIPAPPSFVQYCRYEPVILFHHLFIGGFGFLVIVYLRGDLGDCTFGFVYLMELSTPFVSIRGILSRLKLKESKAYLINGVLMLVTFFLCRVASLPYVCLVYSRQLQLPYWQAVKSLPTGCKVSICILLLPQLYWFYLMSAGAIKMLLAPSPPLAAGDANKSS